MTRLLCCFSYLKVWQQLLLLVPSLPSSPSESARRPPKMLQGFQGVSFHFKKRLFLKSVYRTFSRARTAWRASCAVTALRPASFPAVACFSTGLLSGATLLLQSHVALRRPSSGWSKSRPGPATSWPARVERRDLRQTSDTSRQVMFSVSNTLRPSKITMCINADGAVVRTAMQSAWGSRFES